MEFRKASDAPALIGAARATLASAQRGLERSRAEPPSLGDRWANVGIGDALAALDPVFHDMGSDLLARELPGRREAKSSRR